MNMPKSALLIGNSTWGQHGGIQRFNRRVIESLKHIGVDASILMLNDPRSAIPDNELTAIGFDGKANNFIFTLVRQARQHKILLVAHINLLPVALVYKLLNPTGRIVMFAHGIEVWGDPQYRKPRFYDHILLHKIVDVVAVVSKFSQTLMSKTFKLPDHYFRIFPNAINIPAIQPTYHPKKPKILVVSRLGSNETEKHVDKVILAFYGVVQKIPTARLHIVGDGPLKQGLIDLGKKLGVADQIHFSGFVTDQELQEEYETAAVFALPSSKEGFGIVYLEAWTKGLPVIASRFGAGAEVVSDGLDGYTVDPYDSNELRDRLLTLLEDSELAQTLAEAGYRKARSQYSSEAFAQRLKHIIASENN